MTHAFTRATWAYAAVLFVVLFAPHLVRDPEPGSTRLWSLFPDGFTLLGMAVVQFLAVRQAVAASGSRAAGAARGMAVAGVGAVLYALGSAVAGTTFFATPGFALLAALAGLASVAALGAAMSLAFARLLRPRAGG